MTDEEFVKILRISDEPSVRYAADRIEALNRERVLWGEYVALLNEELGSVIPFAASHGWKSSRAEKGKRLRKLLGLEG